MSYKVEITRIEEKKVTYIESFPLTKEPTEYKEETYGSGKGVVYKQTFETKECVKTETSKVIVLSQEVETLDLQAVIKAINGIS